MPDTFLVCFGGILGEFGQALVRFLGGRWLIFHHFRPSDHDILAEITIS